ncbi:PE-PPE domain-containing protein [Mycolicibacterium chubuense NBB4]|uniref:PE-PPE domain-containing protein n=1 Tax=Mycolicibacterium chubuense (strain NBB4) TaxID=710421 RepID=I4BEA8_MYCCN|nr:PE-PPE domain-containing protein [Mycolicibacterium chubuense]AFM15615.1 PE-PPE domain-containing protein [Mycolicibacterium chubuense NBB4]
MATVFAVATPGAADASTALILGGKGKYAKLTDQQMSDAFGGYFADYDQRINVPFPGTSNLYKSVQVGTDNLYAAVYATPGPKTIGGVSEGAPSVIEVLRRLEADAADPASGKTPPPKEEMNVAIYGLPSKRFLGDLADQPMPVTPYDIIIVKAEYDGIADFPDNTWNMLAVTNALMGAVQLHVKQSNFDIRNLPTEYTIETNDAGGTTTTILIPTEVLPILGPMVALHFNPDYIAKMDARLRPKIDAAYDRPPMETGIPPTLTGPPGPPPTTTPSTPPVTALTATSVQTSAEQTTAALSTRATSRAPLASESRTATATQPTVADDPEPNTQSGDDTKASSGTTAEAEKPARKSLFATREHKKATRGSEKGAAGSAEKRTERTKDRPSAAGADADAGGGGSAGGDSE